ncbi:hypothetical protein ASZ90_003174 [hydrocarbon metagenome]|uniref:Uncharacterized protein n=1 Tax=hydrocarbon metagenome TaxID=938273 RepID=A0A0W8G1H8_9ZZZZ
MIVIQNYISIFFTKNYVFAYISGSIRNKKNQKVQRKEMI